MVYTHIVTQLNSSTSLHVIWMKILVIQHKQKHLAASLNRLISITIHVGDTMLIIDYLDYIVIAQAKNYPNMKDLSELYSFDHCQYSVHAGCRFMNWNAIGNYNCSLYVGTGTR